MQVSIKQKPIEGEIVDQHGRPLRSMSAYTAGGAGFGNELLNWRPKNLSADAALMPSIDVANARSADLNRNHGIASGAAQLYVDHVVGSHFKPSWKLNAKRLNVTAKQARDLSKQLEESFHEYAEDEVNCWIDAERKRTLTMMIREGIRTEIRSGEILASAEWIKRAGTKYKTAIKMINSNRLSNPDNQRDTDLLRGGVLSDIHGAPQRYCIHTPKNTELSALYNADYKFIDKYRPNGRLNIIHIFEPFEDGQSRGVNRFMSVMGRLKMLDKFQATQLQTAIINAMYAAVIETSLDSQQAFEIMQSKEAANNFAGFMDMKADFSDGAGVELNGSRISHLFPGEHLNLQRPGNTASGFSDFEAAVIRYVAAGLGVSYEQLSRDYSRVSYSAARASGNESHRSFMGKRKVIASPFASSIAGLWLEEAFSYGDIIVPKRAKGFYEAKSAWCNVRWIGAGRQGIDGLKEVKEAILRIEAGLSTYEKELALMGEDYRDIFDQQVIEIDERKKRKLPIPSWLQVQQLAPDAQDTQAEPNNASNPQEMSDR